MKKLFRRENAHSGKQPKNVNNSGMTLVEVLVATTIFTILAGMIVLVAHFCLKQQTDAERLNDQTDKQTAYLSEKRYDDPSLAPDFSFDGGLTDYTLYFITDAGDEYNTNKSVEMYEVNTQYDYNDAAEPLPTNKEEHIGFFRVS